MALDPRIPLVILIRQSFQPFLSNGLDWPPQLLSLCLDPAREEEVGVTLVWLFKRDTLLGTLLLFYFDVAIPSALSAWLYRSCVRLFSLL